MSVVDWIVIGISATMLLLMILGWLGVYPQIIKKALPKRTSVNLNGFAILLGLGVIAVVYLAIAGKEIPTGLISITMILAIFYLYTK